MRKRQAAELDAHRVRSRVGVDVIELAGIDHRAVDAHAQVAAAALGHDAAVAGAEAARHARLECELRGHLALLAHRSHGFEHRCGATGVDGRVRVALQLLVEQLGDEPVVANRAVVARDARVAQQRGALGASRVAEAEQHADLAGERVLQDRERRDADAAADKQRAPSVGCGAEAAPQRAEHPQLVTGAQLAQPLRTGTDVLEQEVRLAVLLARDRERSREIGSILCSSPPALDRREHRELAGCDWWAVWVLSAQDAVGPQLVDTCDRQLTPAERCVAHATPAPSGVRAMPCSSCRHKTGSPPTPPLRCALAIARAAEMPAASVVRQGMPCATAARRIS